jgi:hypothetical protein
VKDWIKRWREQQAERAWLKWKQHQYQQRRAPVEELLFGIELHGPESVFEHLNALRHVLEHEAECWWLEIKTALHQAGMDSSDIADLKIGGHPDDCACWRCIMRSQNAIRRRHHEVIMRPEYSADPLDGGRYRVTVTSPPWANVGDGASVVLTSDQFERFLKWQRHEMLIQDAMHDLSAEDREVLISGIGPNKWDELWGEDDS